MTFPLDPAAVAATEALDFTVRGFLFALHRENGALMLSAPHLKGYGAIAADWTTADVLRRIAAGRQQGLAKAVGLNKMPSLQVLDGTGGLGRDAITLAALGATVRLVERTPALVALLLDAQARALHHPKLAEAAARLTIEHGDTATVLGGTTADVVYLDPMYPDDGKRALPAKEMQVLRELTGGDADADALLAPALAAATRRVVVKRPSKAPWLAGEKPDLLFEGSQARFDVYLKAAGR